MGWICNICGLKHYNKPDADKCCKLTNNKKFHYVWTTNEDQRQGIQIEKRTEKIVREEERRKMRKVIKKLEPIFRAVDYWSDEKLWKIEKELKKEFK